MFFIALKGFLLSASLIIAIGLQNAFILRQGLKNRHVFVTALTASCIDASLIVVGIMGLGKILEAMPGFAVYVTWGGIVFLIFYGFKNLFNAFRAKKLDEAAAKGMIHSDSVRATIAALLGVSVLNPHVYLDTVILIGTVGSAYKNFDRLVFGMGAITASFAWFFALAYGARFLSPLFQKPKAWQILDILIALVMFTIAASLLTTVL